MTTFLRRALPTVLVAGGTVLAFAGLLTDAGDHVVPSALLLVIAGGAAALYLHLNRPRRATPVLRVTPATSWVVPVVPTQRSAPHCSIPAPRTAPDADPALRTVAGSAGRWSTTRSSGVGRGGVRHCVLPRGELPHQRRATDGS